jgi:hypothetical protein
MQTITRKDECKEIERFAAELGRVAHCTYNNDAEAHTLKVDDRSITITREEFDDRLWQKKLRSDLR